MIAPDYSTVVGVDQYHFWQLAMTWPTWKRHKPSLLKQPMVVFCNSSEPFFHRKVKQMIDHPDLRTIEWPISGLDWDRQEGKRGDKFSIPHRAMMLSGFVYVPAAFVQTSHWLKLDTDVVATGMDDWIDPAWFDGCPAIVSHRWTFTRPADQMLKMDQWVEKNRERMPPEIARSEPLNLVPRPGWDRVGHKRIISWCGFFDTTWTRSTAMLTRQTDGTFRLPIPSQDGFLFYMAARGGKKVVRANMKSRGWQHWSTWDNIEKHAREAMK